MQHLACAHEVAGRLPLTQHPPWRPLPVPHLSADGVAATPARAGAAASRHARSPASPVDIAAASRWYGCGGGGGGGGADDGDGDGDVTAAEATASAGGGGRGDGDGDRVVSW